MIQETCVEIGELEARWTSLREARNARRQKIRYIDELIDAFEKLNLADEVEVPYELVGTGGGPRQPRRRLVAGRPPERVDDLRMDGRALRGPGQPDVHRRGRFGLSRILGTVVPASRDGRP